MRGSPSLSVSELFGAWFLSVAAKPGKFDRTGGIGGEALPESAACRSACSASFVRRSSANALEAAKRIRRMLDYQETVRRALRPSSPLVRLIQYVGA